MLTKIAYCLLCLYSCMKMPVSYAQETQRPLRLAIAGITHGHVPWILRGDKKDVVVAGIYETDTALIKRYQKQFHLDEKLFYTDLGKMLDAVKPEATVAFGSIYEHMAVVEACAPRHIHVMVEKPLATNTAHALRMKQLAEKNHIWLLTNFETSWYPTTEKMHELVSDTNTLGNIRKVVIHDGHQGPKEIGVNKEFFAWLTDPVQNGGGALIDFGCYGANLITYLMHGQQPVSVTAVTQHFKPDIYPKVDDEATIIVSFAKAQCIIQASWNWPFGRKDMEVYGEKGYAIAVNDTMMRIRMPGSMAEQISSFTTKDVPVYKDPFSYLADVIRGKIKVLPFSPYSLDNNVMAVKILSAARESAKQGRTIVFKK
ncbi:MAG: Gfo/Idh/MocA family oxidoreductase [Ginsengibacter sp.]